METLNNNLAKLSTEEVQNCIIALKNLIAADERNGDFETAADSRASLVNFIAELNSRQVQENVTVITSAETASNAAANFVYVIKGSKGQNLAAFRVKKEASVIATAQVKKGKTTTEFKVETAEIEESVTGIKQFTKVKFGGWFSTTTETAEGLSQKDGIYVYGDYFLTGCVAGWVSGDSFYNQITGKKVPAKKREQILDFLRNQVTVKLYSNGK